MNVIVKRSVLERLMKQIAEERGRRSVRIDQIAGDDKIIIPDEQMSTQLSQDKVPVEDPNFLPVNTDQLTKAASQIARDVKPAEVQKFYSSMKKLLRQDDKQLSNINEAKLKKFVGDEDSEEQAEDPAMDAVVSKNPAKSIVTKSPKSIKSPAAQQTSAAQSLQKSQKNNIPDDDISDNAEISDAEEKENDEKLNKIGSLRNLIDNVIIYILDFARTKENNILHDIVAKFEYKDIKTGESISRDVTAARDDIKIVMTNLLRHQVIQNLLNGLKMRLESNKKDVNSSIEIILASVKEDLMNDLAKRVSGDELASIYTNGIIEMVYKRANNDEKQFKKSISQISNKFSVPSAGINITVNIPGIIPGNQKYVVEVPRNIDFKSFESVVKKKLNDIASGAVEYKSKGEMFEPDIEPSKDEPEEEVTDSKVSKSEDNIEFEDKINFEKDLGFIYGHTSETGGSSSIYRKNLGELQLGFEQSLYEILFRMPGREFVAKAYDLDEKNTENIFPDKLNAFFSTHYKESEKDFNEYQAEWIKWKKLARNAEAKGETLPEQPELSDTLHDAAVDEIDNFIKKFINSTTFKNNFSEYIGFKEHTKESPLFSYDIPTTVHRLGFKEGNSLKKLMLGFAETGQELINRCELYINNKINDLEQKINIPERIKNNIDNSYLAVYENKKGSKFFFKDRNTGKIKLIGTANDRRDEIKKIKQIVKYIDAYDLESIASDFYDTDFQAKDKQRIIEKVIEPHIVKSIE